ncbi:MAG: DUF1893 domain-containing protein [Oscillospiraceae bacterium]
MKEQEALMHGGYALVLARKGLLITARRGIGVQLLLEALDRHPEDLCEAQAADQVVGKGAAMLMVRGGVCKVYGKIMSQAAERYLTFWKIPHEFGTLVPMISDRAGNGICPIEQSVLKLNDPIEGERVIRQTVSQLMKPNQ